MVFQSAAQVLLEADELKPKVLKKCDLLADSQSWTDQQKLQSCYRKVLILDLEYALDKKVEQDLWNIGFKNHISALQDSIRDKTFTRRSEAQVLLTWCLESASGFYLSLLQELCSIFDVDLPFRRRGNIYGYSNSPTELQLPQSTSCLYIFQYCLVHLGDIARYKNQRKQADNFYKQASIVSPTSGHPYNQLALLEASQGNKLSTVFYYVRGIAVKYQFPASVTNLLSTLNSTVDRESPLEKVQTKITSNELINVFLCTHAFLHTATNLQQAQIGVKTVNTTMTALVATQSFTTEKLIKMTAINLYALNHLKSNAENELTEDEKQVRHLVLELLAGSLSAMLIPVHTLKNDESILDYYALSAVKLLSLWIKNEPTVLEDSVFASRLQIWPSLCKLLNNLQEHLKGLSASKYSNSPLSEDRFLQGFRPLLKSFKALDFSREECDEKCEKLIRAKRLVDFGLFLTEQDVNNSKLITKTEKEGKIIFEPGCIQPDPTNDLLEQMKTFKVSDNSSQSAIMKTNENKRGGILKPQGSLEKAREEREMLSSGELNFISDLNNVNSPQNVLRNKNKEAALTAAAAAANNGNKQPGKRSKQNVAIQSIFKKIEESKQVKFNVDLDPDRERLNIFEQTQLQPPPHFGNNAPLQPPSRAQQFGQNHIFPSTSSGQHQQPDYIHALRNLAKPAAPGNNNPAKNFVYPNTFSSTLFGAQGGSAVNMPPPPSYGQMGHPGVGRPMPPPYQQYNMNAMEEVQPNSNWWPPPAGTYRPENNYPFGGGNNVPYLAPPADFNKQHAANQAAGDMFNSPQWNSLQQQQQHHHHQQQTRMGFLEQGNNSAAGGRYDNNYPISMRQAMLKESTNLHGMPQTRLNMDSSIPGFGEKKPPQQAPQNSPGYSLFNANSWSPNLMGQLRDSKSQNSPVGHLSQQTLITAQGPQSLAQLLEQQQSQKNDL